MHSLLLLGLLLLGPSAAADWVTTESGCRLWNADAEARVTWDGGCRDGFGDGEGTLVRLYANGVRETYVGTLRAGRMHGRGAFTLASGQRYEGDFVNDKATGRGVYTWPNGSRYEGDFVDGVSHGRGVRSWGAGTPFAG